MRVKDLFEDWTDSTTLIYDSYPVSSCRFVTIEVSSYLLEKEGVNAPVYIRVWQHMQLSQVVYVGICHILDAADGKRFRVKQGYPENAWVSCEKMAPFVRISTFLYDEHDDIEYDKWSVFLDKKELAFLQERFKPLTERR